MKREIKFRCWSTKENKWMFGYEYPALGGFSLIGEIVLFGEFAMYELERYFNDFEIMQFINSKDMNGIEVYEGDILKAPSGRLFVVKWHEEEMRWAMLHNDTWYNISMNLLEVIGNIYENPDLLD